MIVYPVTRTLVAADADKARVLVWTDCVSLPCPRRHEHGRRLEVVIGDSERGVHDPANHPDMMSGHGMDTQREGRIAHRRRG